MQMLTITIKITLGTRVLRQNVKTHSLATEIFDWKLFHQLLDFKIIKFAEGFLPSEW